MLTSAPAFSLMAWLRQGRWVPPCRWAEVDAGPGRGEPEQSRPGSAARFGSLPLGQYARGLLLGRGLSAARGSICGHSALAGLPLAAATVVQNTSIRTFTARWPGPCW